MSKEEVSWEEQNYLRKLCVIPTLIAFCAILAYFVYLMHNNALKSAWDYLLHIGLLFAIIPSITFMLTFEVLYSRRVKMPLKHHLKRFTGRVLLLLAALLSFFVFLAIVYTVLSPLIGDRAIVLGSVIWGVGLFIIAVRFNEFLAKLSKGQW
ncbi:hypothetical protein DRO25_02730 [Candidatus Bathyarchaeota archaeon]|nr:MAG: hypothetical protein DRO25_02730 [Candidatus Bathyarchaeota archaeon]